MLSQTAQYALRTVVLIAARPPDQAVSVEEIASELGVPRNYLSKTLHQLARAGVLRSTRGPGGGFRLAVPAARLPLVRIIERFDDIGTGRRCLLGQPQCSDRKACRAHDRWKAAGEAIVAFFRDTTVADLLDGHRSAVAG
ncbi:MAG TPA: Rrf2 family transcriptional regulator [Gemmatimonadales bacterium]|nr:Rrf2 family transcriptional regulator [Gemmatimonadales bacterium]